MNKKLYLLVALIGFIGLFAGCEKDEDKATLLENAVAPSIKTMPDLTLLRENGTNTLQFIGTPVNPGFNASVTYILEVCANGNNFEESLTLYSGVQDTLIQFTVSELNSLLLKSFNADQVSTADFRIRAVLVVDAGTGALGTGSNPLEYSSDVQTSDITIYGLPRLDLKVGSEIIGKVESALGNGEYVGYIKLDVTKLFTLFDPDNTISYGSNTPGTLVVDGAAITPDQDGWSKVTANTNTMTYETSPYAVSIVGAFNNWGETPDLPMDYNAAKGYWYATVDLVAGEMKFRLNSAWSVNWGPGSTKDLPANGVLDLPNSNGNINITAAGNYTIRLTLNGSSGSCIFIKNN